MVAKASNWAIVTGGESQASRRRGSRGRAVSARGPLLLRQARERSLRAQTSLSLHPISIAANRGLGYEVVKKLAADGHPVILAARDVASGAGGASGRSA
jgi:hypothetical protein